MKEEKALSLEVHRTLHNISEEDLLARRLRLELVDKGESNFKIKCILCNGILQDARECSKCLKPFCLHCFEKLKQTHCPNDFCQSMGDFLREVSSEHKERIEKQTVVCREFRCPANSKEMTYSEY